MRSSSFLPEINSRRPRFPARAGWDIDLLAHVAAADTCSALCGYQMLGHSVADPHGIEGPAERRRLGLLDVTTVNGAKSLTVSMRFMQRAASVNA
jgi:adenosylcobyric acid synthase